MAAARRMIGEILVELGLVSPQQIQQALRQQMNGDTKKIGEILVEMGVCSTEDITMALAEQHAPDVAHGRREQRADSGVVENRSVELLELAADAHSRRQTAGEQQVRRALPLHAPEQIEQPGVDVVSRRFRHHPRHPCHPPRAQLPARSAPPRPVWLVLGRGP